MRKKFVSPLTFVPYRSIPLEDERSDRKRQASGKTRPPEAAKQKGAITMASVSGVSGSNANSSIYGNRNVLSGLATGMDTESMIENAVSGYKLKISGLQQRQTGVTWQQEAYRNITDPVVQFAQKYTSYTSSTNLYSAGFFDNALKTASNGVNGAKISAGGRTDSEISILGVKQLATTASYVVSASALGGSDGVSAAVATGTSALDLTATQPLSNVSGTMSLSYGTNNTIGLTFDDLETYADAEAFTAAINSKLAQTTTFNTSGKTVMASTLIKAQLQDGKITFTDQQGAGNSVKVSDATGKMKTTLGITDATDTLDVSGTVFTDSTTTLGDYVSGKTLSLNVDGITKKITLPTYNGLAANPTQDFVTNLNTAIQSAFGAGVSVGLNGEGKLQITGQVGSTIAVNTTQAVGKALGLGGSSATSYLNTENTLGSLLTVGTDGDGNETLGGLTGTALKSAGTITQQDNGTYTDSSGNLTDASGNRLGADGKQLYSYDLTINGTKVGSYTRDTSLRTVLQDINSSEAGVDVGFSKTSNQFRFTAQNSGANGSVTLGSDLAGRLFGGGAATAGQDAVVTMSVNGNQYSNVTRSSNTFDVDGMSVTLKGSFGYTDGMLDSAAADNAVTFTTTSDADKIVDAVSGMVDELNSILKSVHSAYATQPLKKSNNSAYKPLTEDDQDGMSEAAIEKYNTKAKTGILFGDSDLSSMYAKLVSAISPGGTAGTALREMGIDTNYSNGTTTLTLDKDALRTALANDPDSVRDAFTSTTGSHGLMNNIKAVTDYYTSTSGAVKGILVQKAGSTYSSLSMLENNLQDQLDDLDIQISSWQDKMADKIDYYTSRFTKLEKLTAEMNSQSSMLSGLLGR